MSSFWTRLTISQQYSQTDWAESDEFWDERLTDRAASMTTPVRLLQCLHFFGHFLQALWSPSPSQRWYLFARQSFSPPLLRLTLRRRMAGAEVGREPKVAALLAKYHAPTRAFRIPVPVHFSSLIVRSPRRLWNGREPRAVMEVFWAACCQGRQRYRSCQSSGIFYIGQLILARKACASAPQPSVWSGSYIPLPGLAPDVSTKPWATPPFQSVSSLSSSGWLRKKGVLPRADRTGVALMLGDLDRYKTVERLASSCAVHPGAAVRRQAIALPA